MIHDVRGEIGIVEVLRAARAGAAHVVLVPAGTTKDESLAFFAKAMDFPAWFGGNLDAFADCLGTAMTAAPHGLHVVWDGVRTLEEEQSSAYEGIRSVLDDLTGDHPGSTVTIVHRW